MTILLCLHSEFGVLYKVSFFGAYLILKYGLFQIKNLASLKSTFVIWVVSYKEISEPKRKYHCLVKGFIMLK